MIVYGDHSFQFDPRLLIARIRSLGSQIRDDEGMLQLLMQCGELCQGLLDWKYEKLGCEAMDNFGLACSSLLRGAGECYVRIKDGSNPAAFFDFITHSLNHLENEVLPEFVTIKLTEGFAFYCVYPESYYYAAQKCLNQFPGSWIALGIRSIGTSLSAVVSAALRSSLSPITFRPCGPPFQRKIEVSSELEKWILSQSVGCRFAIVDEGPGLSGSSFGSVADWLEEIGVERERIHFFPSHEGGLGPHASPEHRERWERCKRHVVTFDQTREGNPNFEFLKSSQELSGGQWRNYRNFDSNHWPPVISKMERRKFLIRNEQGQVILAKFHGLSGQNDRRWKIATVLSDYKLIPKVIEYRYGFILQEWIDGAQIKKWNDRILFVTTVGRYLRVRDQELSAKHERGASPNDLLQMAIHNAGIRFGNQRVQSLHHWSSKLDQIEKEIRPVCVDGKMHIWEWIQSPDGRFVKCDALDHYQSHTLIGVQDIYWDIVGAVVELNLDGNEMEYLESIIFQEDVDRKNRNLFHFYYDCYLAFQIGYYRMALSSEANLDSEESKRLIEWAERYESLLETRLDSPWSKSCSSTDEVFITQRDKMWKGTRGYGYGFT